MINISGNLFLYCIISNLYIATIDIFSNLFLYCIISNLYITMIDIFSGVILLLKILALLYQIKYYYNQYIW